MLGERDSLRRKYQGIAAIAVGFGKCAVNSYRQSAALDRFFSFIHFNGDVAVDDQPVFLHSKFFGHATAKLWLMNQRKIGVLVLFSRLCILNEIVFEGGHSIFAKERGTRPGPEIPEPVRIAARRFGFSKTAADDRIECVEKSAPGVFLAINCDRKKISAVADRHTAVEDQGVIAAKPHGSTFGYEGHVFPEAHARNEGLPEAVHASPLFRGEFVRVSSVNCGKVRIEQRVYAPVDFYSARHVVDSMQQVPMFHFPLGMSPA